MFEYTPRSHSDLHSAPLWKEKIISWLPHAEQNPQAKIGVKAANMWSHSFIHQLLALCDLTMSSEQFLFLAHLRGKRGHEGLHQGSNFLGNRPNVFILSASA